MYCRRCRYPLQDLTEHRCPECGRSFDPDNHATFRASPRRVPRWLKRATVAFLGFAFVTAAYGAAYEAAVQPGPYPTTVRVLNLSVADGAMGEVLVGWSPQPNNQPSIAAMGFQRGSRQRIATYKVGGTAAEWVFAPANYVDRRLRPLRWLPVGC